MTKLEFHALKDDNAIKVPPCIECILLTIIKLLSVKIFRVSLKNNFCLSVMKLRINRNHFLTKLLNILFI